MSDTDLLIFTLYTIGIAFVIYKAITSVGEQVEIEFNANSIKKQLADKNLENLMEIRFEFPPKCPLDDVRDLDISIKNNSTIQTIYVEWDRSCLINLNGRSQRIVRLAPGMTYDLLNPQVFSVIAPSKTLREKVTVETVLKRNSETDLFQVGGPLIIKPRAPITLPPSFKFFLRLVVRLSDPVRGVPNEQHYFLECEFTVTRLPWTANLPWNLKR